MKVLIVDDEPAVLQMYQEKLIAEGFKVILAQDGKSGIDKTKSENPDIVMLDIIMPKINGLDVLKELKKDPDTQKIPVFLLTNLPEECSADKCKSLGADGYLVKAQYEPSALAQYLKTFSQQARTPVATQENKTPENEKNNQEEKQPPTPA